LAYENMTPEAIRAQIIENTGANVNTDEGTFVSDMAAAIALEMSKAYGQLDAALQIMFANTSDSDYLEARAAEVGIYRKQGVKATGEITVSGTVDAVLPAGAVVMTETGLKYTTDEELTLTDETGTVAITAESVGDAYNVAATEVNTLGISYAGIIGVTNESPITGGVDAETDDALRERFFVRLRMASTSGNAHHYRQWALEVDGVGDAKVTPLADGPGTVGILIVGADKGPLDPEVVSACAAHIEEVRPIGATVTVTGASATTINVTASVQLDGTVALADVEDAFEAALDKYLKDISFKVYSVTPSRVGYVLLSVNGVADYSNLEINGGSSAVTIPANNVPVLGGVTLAAV
jgi:uncharacterized phage protein gp47/JayE